MSVERTPLHDACRAVMEDRDAHARHPEGMDAKDILTEIRTKDPEAFPLISILDVIDCMREMYGPGRPA